MISVTGGFKKVVTNKIKILKQQIKFGHFMLMPQDEQNMKDVEYLIENNLPINRQKLYEFAPEIFAYEVKDHLDIIERKRELMKLRLAKVI